MNLIPLELRALLVRGVDDDSPFLVHLSCHVVRRLLTVTEERHKHFDDVIIAVVVVIEKDDVVLGNERGDFLNIRIILNGSFGGGFGGQGLEKSSVQRKSYKQKKLDATGRQ